MIGNSIVKDIVHATFYPGCMYFINNDIAYVRSVPMAFLIGRTVPRHAPSDMIVFYTELELQRTEIMDEVI